MTLDRLSAEDVQVLKREGGAICGHTCKVIVLERSGGRPLPTLDGLRQHISARLDAAPRLRQRLVATPLKVANPAWLDDPEFDIARHVTRFAENGAVDQPELPAIVARLMSERLDRAHPLWHLSLVEDLERDRAALVWRIHHCLADGTTAIRLGSAVLWSAAADPDSPAPSSWRPEPAPGMLGLLARGLADRARAIRASAPPSPRRPASVLHSGALKRELGRSAALTPLAHRVGSARTVGFASAPLEDVRRAGKTIDQAVTINDVVLAVIAGGVGAWLEHGATHEQGIRVKIPVSLHGRGADDGAANCDSYFFVDLPVAERDPSKRVLAINRETRERKLGHDAETLYRLGQHPFVAHWAMSPHVFTFNVSNVRGPADDVYVLGAKVSEMYSLAEIAQHHALRVAVISAGGSLFFGLCADRDAVKDLDVLAEGLRRSVDELLSVVG